MSGIEVAGLILGTIPILLEGLSAYKDGIKSVRTGLQRQKEVAKLCRSLRLQDSLLGELLNTIVLQSGCELDFSQQLMEHEGWKDGDTQAAVREYLGPHYDSFVGELENCHDMFQQLLHKLIKFVPHSKVS
jgi:hypothetical protein